MLLIPLMMACQSTPDEVVGPPSDLPTIADPVGSRVYELDTTAATTELIFTGIGTTGPQSGTWNSWNVQVARPGDTLDDIEVTLVVDATTISTSINQLTNHLRTEDFFDVDQFPHAGFVSDSVTLIAGDRYEVVGDMTLRGTTLEHTFEATIIEMDDALHATATMEFSRFEYGLHNGNATDAGSVSPGDNEVTLTFDVTLSLNAE